MKKQFAVGQRVRSKSGGPVRVITAIRQPSREWKRNWPGEWVWLYFAGQRGGFQSTNYQHKGD